MKLIDSISQESPVCKVRFHPAANGLASISATRDSFLLWNWNKEMSLARVSVLGGGGEARYLRKDCAYHPRGNVLAVAGTLRSTELLYLENNAVTNGPQSPDVGPLARQRISGPWEQARHHCVQFSSLGDYLVAGSAVEAKTDVFDIRNRCSVDSFWISHSLVLHPTGELLATVLNDQGGGGVHFVGLGDKLRCYSIYLEAFPNIGNLVFSPAGNRLALVLCCIAFKSGWYLAYQVHDFPSCSLLWRRIIAWPDRCCPSWLRGYKPATYPVERAIFNANGDRLLCPCPSGDIVEFDIEKDTENKRWTAHDEFVMTLDVRYRDALLVSGGSDGYIKLWQLDDSYRQLGQPKDETVRAFLGTTREVEPFANYWQLDFTTGGG